jgi:hypothetical protein
MYTVKQFYTVSERVAFPMKIQRIVLGTTFAVAIAFGAANYRVNFNKPAVVGDSELKSGEYKLELNGNKATLKNSKTTVEADVSVETSPVKFAETSQCCLESGKYHLQEIRIGGTNTKVVFRSTQTTPAGN